MVTHFLSENRECVLSSFSVCDAAIVSLTPGQNKLKTWLKYVYGCLLYYSTKTNWWLDYRWVCHFIREEGAYLKGQHWSLYLWSGVWYSTNCPARQLFWSSGESVFQIEIYEKKDRKKQTAWLTLITTASDWIKYLFGWLNLNDWVTV